MDALIPVQRVERGVKRGDVDILVQRNAARFDAGSRAALHRAALIAEVVLPRADAQYRERRNHAARVQRGGARRRLLIQRRRDGRAF